jgi:purine nucleosidase
MPDYELKRVLVMNADCIGYKAAQVTDKILYRLRENLPAAQGPRNFLADSRPWNPFPWSYRGESAAADCVPDMKALPPPDVERITARGLERCIRRLAGLRHQRVTILVLCPLTLLADAFRVAERQGTLGRLDRSIEQIIWMGGAFEVDGNIDPTLIGDGSTDCAANALNLDAEWNVFSDPDAAADVVEVCEARRIPLTIFPLDVTDQVKVTTEHVDTYFPEGSPYPAIEFARQMYHLVTERDEFEYSFWDTLTTGYLGNPGLFQFDYDQHVTVTRSFDDLTGTYRSPGTAGTTRSAPGGNVKIATGFAAGNDEHSFLAYFSRQLEDLAWS